MGGGGGLKRAGGALKCEKVGVLLKMAFSWIPHPGAGVGTQEADRSTLMPGGDVWVDSLSDGAHESAYLWGWGCCGCSC